MMQVINQEAIRYYRFESWPGLRHGVFTRYGGVSGGQWASLNVGGSVGDLPENVGRNQALMYAALGVNGARARSVWQVHGAETIVAHPPPAGQSWSAYADGMVTDEPDTPLVMRYADCVPLLFYAPAHGVIGIAHAGWRGTVLGAGASVLDMLRRVYGVPAGAVQVGIGPSIGPERYQVGEEVVAAVRDYFGDAPGLIRRDPHDGTAYLDLWEANRFDLERQGVTQIEIAGICTAQNTAEFYSHRAENGSTGRFGVVISL